MKIRSFLGIATAVAVILTYSVQSPVSAYPPGDYQIFEAKDGRAENHKRNESQDKNKKEEEKKDHQNNEDKNKKDHNQDKDQNQNNDQDKNQQNDDQKKHHNNHDQNQNNHDQNNEHHNEDQNHNNEHQDQDQNHNNQNHDHDQNNQHHDQNNDHDNQHNHNNKHDSWHDDDSNPALIIGLLLFQSIHERSEARRVISRTAVVLQRAQTMARQDGGDYHHSYGLGRAFSHQRWALDLFRAGRYQEAAFHSLHARNIALRFMHRMEHQAEGYWQDDDYDQLDRDEFDDAEIAYWDRCPSESELSIELDKWYVSDDDALNIHIELNF